MSKVKFVQASMSVAGDPKAGRMIETCAVDDKGRVWVYDYDDYKWHLVESPDEPKGEQNEKT